MNNLKFSGHESFVYRHFWPKKGYDFVSNDKSFNDDYAVVDLGVGKNMVSSIHFWMKATNLLDNDNQATDFADFIFNDEEGLDPYLEDTASLWLLHYYLIKNAYSSIYNLVFNELRKMRFEFTKDQLDSFIRTKCSQEGSNSYNENTVDRDIRVFLRNYIRPELDNLGKDYEDELSGIFQGLGLIKKQLIQTHTSGKKVELFSLDIGKKDSLPIEILLFVILDQFERDANISFKKLEVEPNSPGLVFCLSREALYQKLKEIEDQFEEIIISETAGHIVLSIKKPIDKWNVLRNYYGN